MNKQDAMQELNELRTRADALEKIINEPEKPEFEVGMFGEFWDADYHICGYLDEIRNGNRCSYRVKSGSAFWQNFQPITEAILPPWIEHDGNISLPVGVNLRDIVEGFYGEGVSDNRMDVARSFGWSKIVRYRIIKKAESNDNGASS